MPEKVFSLVKVKLSQVPSVQFTSGKIAMNDASNSIYKAKSHVRQDKTGTPRAFKGPRIDKLAGTQMPFCARVRTRKASRSRTDEQNITARARTGETSPSSETFQHFYKC